MHRGICRQNEAVMDAMTAPSHPLLNHIKGCLARVPSVTGGVRGIGALLAAQFYGGMSPAIYLARLHEAISVTHSPEARLRRTVATQTAKGKTYPLTGFRSSPRPRYETGIVRL